MLTGNTSFPDKLGSAEPDLNRKTLLKLKFSALFCILAVRSFRPLRLPSMHFQRSWQYPQRHEPLSPIEMGETQAFALMEAPGGEPQSVGQPPGKHQWNKFLDQAGAVAVGANVRITHKDQVSRMCCPGDNGQFSAHTILLQALSSSRLALGV